MATSKGHKHPKITFHAPIELISLVKERATLEDKSVSGIIVDALWFYLTNTK